MQSLSQHASVAVKPLLPESVTKDREGFAPFGLFARKGPSQHWLDPENFEEAALYFGALNLFRPFGPLQCYARCLWTQDDGDVLEDAILLAPIANRGIGGPIPLNTSRRHALPQGANAPRV